MPPPAIPSFVCAAAEPSETPRRRRKEARPAELLAAALELFVAQGFAATRLEDVARRAGVSKGALYLYFDSKQALFEAVVREGILPTLAEGESLLAGYAGSSADLIRELVLGWWELIGATPLGGIPKLVIGEARNFPDLARFYHDQVIRRGRALLAAALERGVARGEFRPQPLETATDVIIAPLLMLAIWRHSLGHSLAGVAQPQENPGLYLETHLDLLLKGLLVERGA